MSAGNDAGKAVSCSVVSLEGALRVPLLDDERIMSQWDSWRRYLIEGGRGSWPRDEFEMLLSLIDAEREDAADEIARLNRRIEELEGR